MQNKQTARTRTCTRTSPCYAMHARMHVCMHAYTRAYDAGLQRQAAHLPPQSGTKKKREWDDKFRLDRVSCTHLTYSKTMDGTGEKGSWGNVVKRGNSHREYSTPYYAVLATNEHCAVCDIFPCTATLSTYAGRAYTHMNKNKRIKKGTHTCAKLPAIVLYAYKLIL